MRYFILFCAAGYLAGATEVRADSLDCDAIRTTLIPYQIRFTKDHSVWRELHTVQLVRDPSGSDAISGRVNSTTSFIRKGISLNGSLVAVERQYFKRDSHSYIDRWTNEIEGIDPKQVDYRIDLSFVFKEKFERIGGKELDLVRSYDVFYKYRKTDNILVSPCSFIAHMGETTLTERKTGQAHTIFSWYFPDLRLLVGNPSPDVTFQSISTTFEPIDFEEPNWPPASSKVNDH
ncbi:hypothetical protein [Bradyrhizobium sp. SYSU BS000235]|uniref:hypothetical protein n=1 Tax=Bradyrhizobium sp. SYSU BS000235 TaxID=3411332 RepID=UPI003C794090